VVHAILLEEGMAKEEWNKKGSKKPWMRYERGYSLSAGHMDWYQHHDGRWVCVVLDDVSRKVLAGGEYRHRSAEASVELVRGWQRQAQVRGVLQGGGYQADPLQVQSPPE